MDEESGNAFNALISRVIENRLDVIFSKNGASLSFLVTPMSKGDALLEFFIDINEVDCSSKLEIRFLDLLEAYDENWLHHINPDSKTFIKSLRRMASKITALADKHERATQNDV